MAAINKIAHNSPSRQNPSELETAIAGALFDLESNTQDLKATLRPLQFVSAREVRLYAFLCGNEDEGMRVGNGHMNIGNLRWKHPGLCGGWTVNCGLNGIEEMDWIWHSSKACGQRLTNLIIGRGRPRQEGDPHLRPCPSPPGLPQDPAAVRQRNYNKPQL